MYAGNFRHVRRTQQSPVLRHRHDILACFDGLIERIAHLLVIGLDRSMQQACDLIQQTLYRCTLRDLPFLVGDLELRIGRMNGRDRMLLLDHETPDGLLSWIWQFRVEKAVSRSKSKSRSRSKQRHKSKSKSRSKSPVREREKERSPIRERSHSPSRSPTPNYIKTST